MDDNGDEHDEWAAERRRDCDEEMRRIDTNDPTFTTLTIHYYWEYEWEVLGTAVGGNTHLKELIMNSRREISAIDFRDFVRGLAFNRSIRTLSIGLVGIFSNRDPFPEAWEHLTRFFIDNKALYNLEFALGRVSILQQCEKLVSSLQRFDSLREFTLSSDRGSSADDVIDALIEHHTCLRKLTIKGMDIGRIGCAALATSSLTELHLHLQYGVHINEDGARAFAAGLARNATLKVLGIEGARKITDISWQSIFSAFSTCKVESLDLVHNYLTDATVQTLSNALLHNTTLKSLSLGSNKKCTNSGVITLITNAGWFNLFTSLRGIMLEKLDISYNDIGDIGITVIAESLENNSSLRELDLSYNLICEDGVSALATALRNPNSALKNLYIQFNSIRDIGVIALSSVLRHPNSKLEKLDISYNSIGDIGINALANALENNSTIKELDLSHNSIGDIGVIALSSVLRHPNSKLEKLDIENNSIGDIGINALTHALLNNSMLKELTIEENPDITQAGWINFSSVLRNPTSALEFIEASHKSINDEVAHSFADALSENKTLEELYLGICPPGYDCKITPDGHVAMTNILCNTSSILSTFNSNHTLVAICHTFDEPFKDYLPNDLLSMLKINRENSVSQAARLKIINTHFSGSDIIMQPFLEMNLSVRPHAIAWMAKDMHSYVLLRAMPSLLDQFEDDVIRSKKRTRNI